MEVIESNVIKRKFENPISIFNEILREQSYLGKVFAIAVPSAAQQMLNMIVNLMDTIMIGKLGKTEIASVGLGNKLYFVFILICFGIMSGSGILISQYWGSKNIKELRKVVGIGLILSITIGIGFACAGLFFPEKVMAIFSNDSNTIKVGASYLMAVCLSYPFAAVTGIYNAAARSTGHAKIPLYVALVAIGVNVSLNYVLIFGKFGFPALGVVGAGIATVISRVMEMLLALTLLKLAKSPIICKLKDLLSFNKELVVKFFVYSSPVIANEFMWGLGVTLYAVAYGRMGNSAEAAVTIADSLINVVTVWLGGLASATAVILGNELGANNLDRAKRYGVYSYIMAIIASVLVIIVLLIIMNPFINFYNISDADKDAVRKCILMFALIMPFKGFAWVNIVGILRSGGDTLACLILDVTGVWFIGVPLAFFGGLYWHLPVYIVYGLVATEEIYKTITGYIRYKQYKWLVNLAVDKRG